ncbi:MAG: carbamoyl phosphate synthase small subunit, partial [Mariprofundales bacterium]|nr:carbamoyl phosphate synthase small subunit [Mariprofundales bacterium]
GLQGRDLVAEATGNHPQQWQQGSYLLDRGEFNAPTTTPLSTKPVVVVVDFGCKRNILRMLADRHLDLRLLPADSSVTDILAMRPAGILLSNGPGDPSAVGYAVTTISRLIEEEIPIFGICMGHQLLCQALGLSTFNLKFGHRGGNHPVGRGQHVEISSQNHGFAVADDATPAGIEVTHRSLFDGTIEGIEVTGRPIFSVQYHPEASPGPHDGTYLFDRFASMVQSYADSHY